MTFLVDAVAREIAFRKAVLPECLHVPIAARDAEAVQNYIGDIVQVVGRGTPPKALLVRVKEPPPIDRRYPIWELPGSAVFHAPLQLWVDHSYSRYRHAYRAALPDEDITGRILSHTMNRRIAAMKGFRYVRITPVSRTANSSSAFSEGWGVALHHTAAQIQANRREGTYIQYGDLADLMLMLDMNLGGGIMDAVNEGQKLVRLRT